MAAKLIKSLHQKKNRELSKKFLVEGTKNVEELLASDYRIETLYASRDFKLNHAALLEKNGVEVRVVDPSELAAYGTLEHNDGALAIVWQRKEPVPEMTGVVLALDDIRDPGNLGTIIRTADWYGIKHIICSPSCVDWYNPKVIAATMGSFTRVHGYYADLPAFFKTYKGPVLGAFLTGESAHTFAFPDTGVLLIGSESHGISKEAGRCVTKKVTIPSFGKAESLNAAVATAILLDRWISASK